jgi:hypothetical protein
MAGGIGGAAGGAWTGSILNVLATNIANQSATAVVGGFTNTIAPSTLITAATGSAPYGSLVITNVNKGGVTDASRTGTTTGTTTASISTTTQGNDTYLGDEGAQVFDSVVLPYLTMPYDTN